MKRFIVIGIHDGHNASAALAIDGKIEFAAQEERFTGLKNYTGFPKRAVLHLLRKYQIKPNNIDQVALSTQNQSYLHVLTNKDAIFSVEDSIREMEEYWKPKLAGRPYNRHYLLDYIRRNPKFKCRETVYTFPPHLRKLEDSQQWSAFRRIRKQCIAKFLKIPEEKIVFFEHHNCHIHYGYYSNVNRNPKLPYIGLTIDSEGDGLNQTVWRLKGDNMKLLAKSSQCDLGRLYRLVTLYLGMKPLEHEYKVMGLAPYAKKKYYQALCRKFEGFFRVRGLTVTSPQRPTDLYQWLKNNLQHHRFDNVAGAVQQCVEKVVSQLMVNIYKSTRTPRFVFSGGVAMNVKLNKLLGEKPFVKDFFVCGSSSDESLSIGACYFASRLKRLTNKPLPTLYLGPEITSHEVEKELVKNNRLKKYRIIRSVTPKQIAKLLKDGQVVARAAGRMEFGARALGNRSILADPARPDVVKIINEMIKGRDFWMPFALTVLDKYEKKYLINSKKYESRYMATCMDVQEAHVPEVRGGIHPYDHTVRPQILKEEDNSEYYAIVNEFSKLTGTGAVLNTSLNLHGYPMVNTVKDALFVFENSGLKNLVLGSMLLQKK